MTVRVWMLLSAYDALYISCVDAIGVMQITGVSGWDSLIFGAWP